MEIHNPRDISTQDLHSVTNTLLLDTGRKYQLLVAMYRAVYNNYVALKENVRNLRMFDGLVVQLDPSNILRFLTFSFKATLLLYTALYIARSN